MRSIKMVGIAAVAVFALASVAVAPAFAEEFEANKVGTLAGKATTVQEFKTGSGATVECTKLSTPESKVTELKSTRLAMNGRYETCSVLVFGTATISTLHYTFFTMSAPEGLGVSILTAPAIIKSGGLGEECEIELKEPQEVGTATSEVKYGNTTGSAGKEAITISMKITKIKSKILKSSGPNSKTNCGTEGEGVESELTGELEVESMGAGNNLKVK